MATATLTPEETRKLKESLKRCPDGTLEAAIRYREAGDPAEIPTIVTGIIERFLEPENKVLLHNDDDSVRLFEDLGIDSLTMMEIVILVEETLNVSFDNNELRELRTLGDVKTYIDSAAKGEPRVKRDESLGFEEIAARMPQQPPFLFISRGSVGDQSAKGEYQIEGTETFLEGHFRDNPVFPASIMIEALGQLAVLFLLSHDDFGGNGRVAADKVYFTSCSGVRCHRICKPGDRLKMEVRLKRMRYPLATFEGQITVNEEKTAAAEEITLIFDYEKPVSKENSGGSEPSKAQEEEPAVFSRG